jgi:hypothetical protein
MLVIFGFFAFLQSAHTQVTNFGFETGNFTGWNSFTGTRISTGVTILNWTVNPADSYMASLTPEGFTKTAATSILGFTTAEMSAFNPIINTTTDWAILTKQIYLSANQTIQMQWNYVSRDYYPYNDGAIATFVGPSGKQIKLLAVTANAYGNTTAIVTGSYGSTDWKSVSFTAGSSGTYTLGFAVFNCTDYAVDPSLFIDDAPGGTFAPGEPIVVTSDVSSIGSTSATSGGNVTSDGGATVTARGVCWNNTGSPTTSNSKTNDGSGTGAFTSNLTGLLPGTTYYVRAFATNSVGTVYGGQKSFITVNPIPPDPTSISVTANPICNGTSTQLTANGTVGIVYWYTGSCGGASVGTGNSITVSPGVTTSYYARNFNNGLYSNGCTSATVTVNSAPTISCPSNITVNNTPGQCGANVTFPAATATGSPAPTITYSQSSGSFFNKGISTVTATATNSCGTASCTFNVTVQDNEYPVINCVTNQTIASCADVIPNYTTSATVTDNCGSGGLTITQSPAAGTTIASGTTVSVTLTATDASNNSATCTFTVTRPNITPVANNDAVTVCAGSSLTFSVLGNDTHPQGAALTVSDNTNPSAGTLVKNADNTFTYTSASPSASPVTFTYTIKANDGVIPFSGNNHYYEWVPANSITWQQAKAQAASKSFNGMQGYLVTVTSAAEMAFVNSKLQGQGWMGASDLAYEGTWRWVTGPEGLEAGGLGRHFSNQSKTGNCSANTAPGINGNYANWAGGEPNDCGANIGEFTPTDPNRGGEHYAHFYGGGIWNDYPNSVGAITGYIVEYGGLENCTPVLTATATVSITVNPKPVLSAVITNVMCVGGNNGAIDLSVTSGQAPFTYSWSNGASTQDINNIPTGNYTVTVTSATGCSAQGSYTINQVDNVPPVALAKNVTVQLDASGNAIVMAAQVNNGSSDACGIKSMVLSKSAFNCADISTNPNVVTLTVTDNNNNVSTATAEVTVVDAIAPTALAQNVTVQLDATGNGSTTAALVNNGSNDACGIKTLALSKTAFTCSDIATNPNVVTLTVTDNNGNVSTATANVTVVDAVAPVAIAQNVTVQLDATGNGSTTATLVNNGSNDACGIKSLALSKTAFTCSDIATNPNVVTLTVTDNNGNVSTATANVTVIDAVAPILTVPANIVKLNDPGVCGAVVNIGQATATDNCTVATITNNAPAFFPVGITTVTWTVVDVNGNSTIGTQTVEITNNAPVISGLTVSPLLNLGSTTLASATHADNNLVAATWNWGDGLSTPGTISGTQLSGNHVYSQTGLFNVTLTIEDACGKSDTKTYSYVVIYNPCNGFVTGGGNFTTPKGAYSANTSLTGKSNYGFEVKYEEGKPVPKGEFEFQFTAAKFKMKATTIEWLMVNGDMAVMKGNAKVNEKAGYHFIASVVDGKIPTKNGTDYLRLIVWDNAGNVLYDNQIGDPDYARALTPISYGQIVIHKYKHEKCFGDDFDNKDEMSHDISLDDEHSSQIGSDNASNNEHKNDNGSKTPILVEMTVYPNPLVNNRQIDITIKNFGNTEAKVELSYINGRVVYTTPKVEFSDGKARIDFSKAKLTPGNYLLTVSENGTMRVGVKQIIVL